ncbi:MAG: GNAT family N-acetyltransferase [Arenicellales bacterium]
MNKTPEKFKEWVSNPENFCVIAKDVTRVCGVGLLKRSGEVLLFYVAPGCQRLGIGRRIHDALEAQATAWRLERMYLESTVLACGFYRSLGYQSTGPERSLFGVLRVYPLAKAL